MLKGKAMKVVSVFWREELSKPFTMMQVYQNQSRNREVTMV